MFKNILNAVKTAFTSIKRRNSGIPIVDIYDDDEASAVTENNEQSEIKEESNLEVKATVIAESENVEGEEAAEKDEDRERNILEVTASVIPELEGEEHEEAAEEEEDGEENKRQFKESRSHDDEYTFQSEIPDTTIIFNNTEEVKSYLKNFCSGGGAFGKFKGYCYVVENTWKNCLKLCCDRGGGRGRANHMKKTSVAGDQHPRNRKSTSRKTNCSVTISARRHENNNGETYWQLQVDKVIHLLRIHLYDIL